MLTTAVSNYESQWRFAGMINASVALALLIVWFLIWVWMPPELRDLTVWGLIAPTINMGVAVLCLAKGRTGLLPRN